MGGLFCSYHKSQVFKSNSLGGYEHANGHVFFVAKRKKFAKFYKGI